jgi:hypothetical protein
VHTNHVRYIVTCVAILAALCIVAGAFLLWKGYSGGDVLISSASTAIGGLLGVLSMTNRTGLDPLSPHPPTKTK